MTKAKALTAPRGIATGLNKGHIVNKRKLATKPVNTKGVRLSLRALHRDCLAALACLPHPVMTVTHPFPSRPLPSLAPSHVSPSPTLPLPAPHFLHIRNASSRPMDMVPSDIAPSSSLPHLLPAYPTATHMQKSGKKTAVIRSVIAETVGLAPFERRIVEVLKGGGSNPQKRAYKFAKNRLGAHTRAKRKVKEMEDVISRAALKRK